MRRPYIRGMNGLRLFELREPPVGHERYEPVLVVASLTIPVAPEPWVPTVEVRRFEPVYTDRWVCIYATNGSPRDRMRHDAMVSGERCRTHRFERISQMIS
jgi:hypothetical protein